MYYKQLFNMCGFPDQEIIDQAPRIEVFLKKLKLDNESSVTHCEETVTKNYDLTLKGVQGLLRVFVKETIDAVLAREEHEKIITFTRPVDPTNVMALIKAEMRHGGVIYARSATQVVQQTLGTVFDRINWLIEIGELLGQTAGRAHCSEYQIYAGGMSEGIFPIPDMSITCGWFCDQSPEADVLLSEMFGYPIVTTDGCNNWQWRSWPELDERTMRYIRKTLQNAYEQIRDCTGLEITDEDIAEALKDAAKLTMARTNIKDLMVSADPQPISQADVTLTFYLWATGTAYMDDAIRALNDLQRDIHARIKRGEGVVPKGAPRIYIQLRHCVDMTPIKVIEELGLAIPIMFYDVLHPTQLLPTRFPDDPGGQAIEGLFRMAQMADNYGTLEYWRWVVDTHQVDGVIHICPINCRPWSSTALMAKSFVQKELDGIPYLVVEGDSFDTRNYSAGQIRTRVESFAEVLRMNKAANAGK